MERTRKPRAERYRELVRQRDEGHAAENFENLGITVADLVGKKTLDIGAGGGEFARFANERGADVVALSKYLHPTDERRVAATDTPFVVADAADLPFQDCSFDMTVSHASMPNVAGPYREDGESRESHLERVYESMLRVMREAVRVTKQEGEVRLAPVIGFEEGAERQTIQAIAIRRAIDDLNADPELEILEEALPMAEAVPEFKRCARHLSRLIIRKRRFPTVLDK